MIQLLVQLGVDDADVYNTAGSQLRRAPADGEYRLWAGSDQADGQLSANVGGLSVLEPSEMPVITVNALRIDGPPTYRWKVTRGADVIVNYNEVTGGTATILTQFYDMVDLLMEAGYAPSSIMRELG